MDMFRKLLVSLKVQNDFPLEAVLGFLKQKDKVQWEDFLKDFYYEICVCPEQGRLYLLIRDCLDEQKLIDGIKDLPLVKEGFLDLQIYRFSHFQDLDAFFGNCRR
jgi:hypothetical protein